MYTSQWTQLVGITIVLIIKINKYNCYLFLNIIFNTQIRNGVLQKHLRQFLNKLV